ncbi:MAG: DUF2062 domain-containing protein [Ketobacteraceae bacterium]|nr:DUF2062 domain-containing protein [Ketobacteraceae bacterium]
MPDPQSLRENRWLRVLAPLFDDPNLLHFNRRSIAAGVFCGVFAAFIPLPVQMFAAIVLAVIFRGNLAVAVGFTWVSNPLTYIPIYYFCYRVGEFIMGRPVDEAGNEITIQIKPLIADFFAGDFSGLMSFFFTSGTQLMLGCFLVGLLSAGISYVLVGYLWRAHVHKSWRVRRLARKQKKLAAQQEDSAG